MLYNTHEYCLHYSLLFKFYKIYKILLADKIVSLNSFINKQTENNINTSYVFVVVFMKIMDIAYTLKNF
jgi:SET domain-containing protein